MNSHQTLHWEAERLLQAWNYAAQQHHGQSMPDTGIAYLQHIGTVTMELMAAFQYPTDRSIIEVDLALCCAVLHDTLEDTPTTYDDLKSRFGTPVAEGVLALSKNMTLPREAQIPDSLNRIQQQPKAVWVVKLADRIANLQPPPTSWSAAKIDAYRQESLLILQTLRPAHAYLASRLAYKIAVYG